MKESKTLKKLLKLRKPEGLPKIEPPKAPILQVRTAEPLSQRELLDLSKPSTKAGPGKSDREPPPVFVERQQKESMDSSWKEQVVVPDWLLSLIETKPKQEQIFAETLKQLSKNPSEKSFHLVRMLMSESMRIGEGGKFLVDRLTPDIINRFMVRSEK